MPATTHAATASPSRPRWLILTAVSLPMFMSALDNLVVTTALPVIQRELGATLAEQQWVVNAYTLCFASLILVAAACGDRWGRHRVFLAGIALFTFASVLCGFSTSPGMLIAARALQGVGAAAVMPLSLALLTSSVPRRLRAPAIGIWGGVSGLGVALGPLIGGAVVEGLEWTSIFWINVPVGVVSIALVLLAVPESRGAPVRIDVPGMATSLVGVFGVVYGIVNGNDRGWTDPLVLGGFAVGLVGLALFVAIERRSREPMLPPRLFRDRTFTVVNAIGLVFSFGIFGAVFLLILFLQVVQQHSPLQAGILTMP
jgi:EmrB/QacA subfamily drug resistance transporter